MDKMFLILKREYLERVAKRSFILTTILTPLLMILLIGGAGLIGYFSASSESSKYSVAVVDDSGMVASSLESGKKVEYSCVAAREVVDITKDKTFSAILFIDNDVLQTNRVKIEKLESSSLIIDEIIESDIEDVVADIKLDKYDVENLHDIVADINRDIKLESLIVKEDGTKQADSSIVNSAMSYIGGFLIYMFVLIYGAQLLTSVIEEKSSKVVEVIISTVSPMDMLMGKVLGVGLVALTQIFIWGVIMVLLGLVVSVVVGAFMINPDMVAKMSTMPSELTSLIDATSNIGGIVSGFLYFMIFFVGGYLIYASLFAAIGSAVSTAQESQNLQTPLTIPIIFSLICMQIVIADPNTPIATVFSLFPLTSPIIMLARLGTDVPMWELILSIVILYGSVWGVIWVAGRIYRVGIMTQGKKRTYKQLYQWIKQK